MIIKERAYPQYITALEALLRRIPQNHPKRREIELDYAKRLAGYRGEQALDYPLGFLQEKEFSIFHDLRLPDRKRHFQLDTLILSQRFALILEVKNIAGTLIFDEDFRQLIRISNEKEEAFADPILQAELQKVQLLSWFSQQKLTVLPVETLVVISHPKTVIKNSLIKLSPESSKKVTQNKDIPFRIAAFQRRYTKEIPQKEMNRISRQLLKAHSPFTPDILSLYEISPNEILKGVHCPNCNHLPMTRFYGKWFCTSCSHSSKTAYLPALNDYVALFGSTITNRELRNFLNIASPSIAAKILHSMNLPSSGGYRNRSYHLTSENEIKQK
ncbi:nuclease-related domain-containing protein [Fictibacillus sp. B-59209]|uniref:nuclease-related domain-containing protein n=1 Tax=Fictibacillus sp. B-59209 TaxID=3024873 RepID=UPI002E1D6C30|nr:nuclease-related domain-containing protein [Fictibacillus sp. B-59209]